MMAKQERMWVVAFTVFVIVLTSIPYAAGYFSQGEEWVFTGFVFGVEDGNSYIAKMLSGAYGQWLFETPYTAYPQNGFFAFFPYLFLGKLVMVKSSHMNFVVLFHFFRWIGCMLMVWATYDFTAVYLKEVKYRKFATVTATLGGGLGWLALLGLNGLWKDGLPLEFYSPETFGFLSLFGLPHLACARAFLLWGLAGYLKSASSKIMAGYNAGFLWLGLGLMQPITVVVGGFVILVHLIVTGIEALVKHNDHLAAVWKLRFGFALKMGLLSAPIVIYTAFSFWRDPFLAEWAQQNVLNSPPFIEYMLAYGVMAVLSIMGIKSAARQDKDRQWVLLFVWVILLPILVYAPFTVQRRLPEGIWVAITILGVFGLSKLENITSKIAQGIVILSFLPALSLVAGSLLAATRPMTPIFRPATEIEVFQWLQKNGEEDEVVLASYTTSNPLPAWAAMKTLVGHGPESIHLAEMLESVEGFYDPSTNDSERLSLVREFSIDYVILGPEEKVLGDWAGETSGYLDLCFRNDAYVVFCVKP